MYIHLRYLTVSSHPFLSALTVVDLVVLEFYIPLDEVVGLPDGF